MLPHANELPSRFHEDLIIIRRTYEDVRATAHFQKAFFCPFLVELKRFKGARIVLSDLLRCVSFKRETAY